MSYNLRGHPLCFGAYSPEHDCLAGSNTLCALSVVMRLHHVDIFDPDPPDPPNPGACGAADHRLLPWPKEWKADPGSASSCQAANLASRSSASPLPYTNIALAPLSRIPTNTT